MTPLPAAWRLRMTVPESAAGSFADLLESHDAAVSWTAPEGVGTCRLKAYFAAAPDAARLGEAMEAMARAAEIPVPTLDIDTLSARDWVDETRKRFPAFSVGRFYIHGPEDAARVPRCRVGLMVEAGLAFGTGRHESTAGCLQALQALPPGRHRPRRVLDLGCGSGILAIAVAKTLRRPVLAVDVDPTAVSVAAVNARLNGVADRVRTLRAPGFAHPEIRRWAPFDLILANILAPPLKRLAAGMARHAAPGGVVVLSGMTAGEVVRVLDRYRGHGFRLHRQFDLGAWRSLVLIRQGWRGSARVPR